MPKGTVIPKAGLVHVKSQALERGAKLNKLEGKALHLNASAKRYLEEVDALVKKQETSIQSRACTIL